MHHVSSGRLKAARSRPCWDGWSRMSDRQISSAGDAGLCSTWTAPGSVLQKCNVQQYFIYSVTFKPNFERSADSRLISTSQSSALLSERECRRAGLSLSQPPVRCFWKSEVHCTGSMVKITLLMERKMLLWDSTDCEAINLSDYDCSSGVLRASDSCQVRWL